MVNLNWGYCQGDRWCPFRTLKLDDDLNTTYGVYVIWREVGGVNFETYVGEGVIGERIARHRLEYAFRGFEMSNSFVTWAEISRRDKVLGRKIEQYLIITLPNVMNSREDRPFEPVNIPWSKAPWLS